MTDDTFDLIIIGSGGAAFGAAIRGAELGARIAMVERGTLGGTCVNIGCVPSKTLLRAAESLHRATTSPFAGVAAAGSLRDFAAVMAQKDELIGELRSAKYAGVLDALDGVTLIRGHARFVREGELDVGGRLLRSDRFVIATGASPWAPPVPGLAESGYLTSTDALALRELPPSMVVLGGRYIALELAQIFARFGSRVTVLQRSPHIVPTEDDVITGALKGYLQAEGIVIETGVKLERVDRRDGVHRISATIGSETRELEAATLLVATGRRPNTSDMGLEKIGAELDGHALQVDRHLASTASGVFGAGDVIGDPAFVYTAAQEGRLAAENALGSELTPRYEGAIPWVMFTDPQLSGVGLNERQAAALDIDVDVSRLSLEHVPRAIAARDTRGIIQLVKEKDGDRLLGATVLAPEAGEMIMEPTLAITHGIGVSSLASALHPYLTQAEGIKLAAQTFSKDVDKLSCCA